MVEIFAGIAILCATAKQAGMSSSLAVDKLKKKACRSTILQLDLCNKHHQALLEQWLQSPLIAWIHLAPVCGTASRAREIRRFEGDPQPLRSNEQPEGLDSLTEVDAERVRIANELFAYACKLFHIACSRGILATMENPRSSYLWITKWVLELMAAWDLYCADFQVCMLGGTRDKWTRIVANFEGIISLNLKCDRKHQHEPWGFAKDMDGKKVWATSLESAYPRKMCIAVVNLVLEFLQQKGLILKANSLEDKANPLQVAQQSQMSVGLQPRPSKIPPVVADSSSVAVFLADSLEDIPCSLLSKLPHSIDLLTKELQPVTVPKYSRFLRFTAISAPAEGGVHGEQNSPKRKATDQAVVDAPKFEVAFGLPWSYSGFIEQACRAGHPALKDSGVPLELQEAVEKHVSWSDEQLASYRIAWCRKWLVRSKELEAAEQQDASARHPEVASLTKSKKLLLTKEILDDIGFLDTGALDLLSGGSPLAGPIEASPSFEAQFRPCLATVEQLTNNAPKMNEAVLRMTTSSGDLSLDKQLLEETLAEVEKGWAEGPFQLVDLPEGSTISRRFPLTQGAKTRMIDDFSISGVNDSCEVSNKLDLHMIDTFCSLIKLYFRQCTAGGRQSGLRAKTYDLKSAYRQVPVKPDHYRFSYFSIYNYKLERPEIYRLKTMPFGAVHSVYAFLRLARMLFSIATKGLFLMCTNFYDDFVLASKPSLTASASCSMEMVFLLTGWVFAQEGSKATQFDCVCKALGVQFDFHRAEAGLMTVCNTESRRKELIQQIASALQSGFLDKQSTLSLRGRLGFADSFMYGRIGKLVLKQLTDHAYGPRKKFDESLAFSLRAMSDRLQTARPREVTALQLRQWFIYTDASYESGTNTGGLGGVLVDETARVKAWFSIMLDEAACKAFGAGEKGAIIYELELLAAVVATGLWCRKDREALYVIFGDNDAVRFSLIRASAAGTAGQALLSHQLQVEADCGLRSWYARVPTEANISDWPSRGQQHELLISACNFSADAFLEYQAIMHNCFQMELNGSNGG